MPVTPRQQGSSEPLSCSGIRVREKDQISFSSNTHGQSVTVAVQASDPKKYVSSFQTKSAPNGDGCKPPLQLAPVVAAVCDRRIFLALRESVR